MFKSKCEKLWLDGTRALRLGMIRLIKYNIQFNLTEQWSWKTFERPRNSYCLSENLFQWPRISFNRACINQCKQIVTKNGFVEIFSVSQPIFDLNRHRRTVRRIFRHFEYFLGVVTTSMKYIDGAKLYREGSSFLHPADFINI